ncbi:MAG TPA: ABC transporter permease [Bryobacteraceae bacterium]|jgi:predicted permease
MAWLREQWQRTKHFFGRRRFDDDLAEEMRLHLDLRVAENPSAERDARIRFGNVARIQENSRAAWRWLVLESIFLDIRYGIRMLASSPAFTVAAIVSLTLAIGANTAIFSLLNATMLRTLPVRDPGQLVAIEIGETPYVDNPHWEKIRDHASALDGALAYGATRFDLSTGGDRQLIEGLMISGSYFKTLGVPAFRGRIILPDDDKRGGGSNGPVAVISQRFWLDHFNGDPSVIGRTIQLDRHAFQVIGVTPAWFTGLDKDRRYDVAVPLTYDPILTGNSPDDSSYWWLTVVGRLRLGITPERAESMLRALDSSFSKGDGLLRLHPFATGFSALGEQYGKALFTLQALVAIVLLIACANVANLLLARAAARQRELSVRLAIGADRGRIIRQLLTESLLLASGAALAGLTLAVWGTRLLVRMLSSSQRLVELDPQLDLNVVAFTAFAVVLTTLAFGLLPALRASSARPNSVLKESAGVGRQFGMTRAIIVIQLALALTLVSAATLFCESFRAMLNVDAGFDSRHVLVANASVPQGTPLARSRPVFEEVLGRLRRIPGVVASSRSSRTPVEAGWWQWSVAADVPRPGSARSSVYFNCVSPGYFQTLGARLIAGRDFNADDSPTTERVVILDEAAARLVLGSAADPVGRTVVMRAPDLSGKSVPARVIGLVKNMKYSSLSEAPHPTMVAPLSQVGFAATSTSFEIQLAPGEPARRALPLIRAAMIATDKNLSFEFQTLEAQVSDSLIEPRLLAAVSGFFGAIALVLAATGLYGVIAYSTARRKSEIGIRMALGATPRHVVYLVLQNTAWTLVIGAAAGLALAYFAGRVVGSLVFGVRPADPQVLGVALAALILTAALAAYLPARRAARVDPMDSLRME